MERRVHIREATLNDVCELVAVEEKAFRYMGQWDRQSFVRRLRNPCAIVLKAEICNQIIGKAVGVVYNGKRKKSLQVQDVSVVPAFRRNGVASRLLATLEGRARDRGCMYSALYVRDNNWSARRLYCKLGYYDISGWDDDMQRMRKDFNGV